MQQVGDAVVLSDAYSKFQLMVAALQKDKNVTLSIVQGYMSTYDVVDELRKLLKDKTAASSPEVTPLLDAKKTIVDIVKEGNFDKLKQYIDNQPNNAFEPPLMSQFNSATENFNVQPFPIKPAKDPRRTGRLLVVGPPSTVRGTEIQKWLYNNSLLYGFLPYGDTGMFNAGAGLYYVGVEEIKKLAKQTTNVVSIIGKYLKSAPPSSLITVTSDKVISNKLPELSFADPGNLETVPGSTVKDNNGNIPLLIVIDGEPVVKSTGLAYLAMHEAAKRDGVTLKVGSGFRPAFGKNFKGTTSTGRSISFTTQETLRRDKSRWIKNGKWKNKSDEDFIFNAPSGQYSAQTAAPGVSQHGSGLALDLNTGRRDKGSLNKTVYTWLCKNAHKFGFVRTVSTEEWHFEYIPAAARKGPYGKLKGTNGNLFFSDLGLDKIVV